MGVASSAAGNEREKLAIIRTAENFRVLSIMRSYHMIQVSMRMANRNTVMLTADKMAFVLLWGNLVKALRRVGLSTVEEVSSK
jgi:hypothetical protein